MNNSTEQSSKYWVVVPAAGVGKRMEADKPKQYLNLAGGKVIEHTLARLASHPKVEAIAVAISEGDYYWPDVAKPANVPVIVAEGGAERCNSVYNGLLALEGQAADDDWVLVHDAARPCLRVADIDKLMESLKAHPVGGILGVPVADTMKRTDSDGVIDETVCRENLWCAHTPQMFRYGMLKDALGRAIESAAMVTDEASAIEWAGHAPVMVGGHAPGMVAGHGDNIKITRPQDLVLAELYLHQQED